MKFHISSPLFGFFLPTKIKKSFCSATAAKWIYRMFHWCEIVYIDIYWFAILLCNAVIFIDFQVWLKCPNTSGATVFTGFLNVYKAKCLSAVKIMPVMLCLQLKDLKRQLHLERKRADKLQERLQEILTNTKTRTGKHFFCPLRFWDLSPLSPYKAVVNAGNKAF